jgi:hypothetical protein
MNRRFLLTDDHFGASRRGDLLICETSGFKNVLPVKVLHAACIFDAEEDLNSVTDYMKQGKQDWKNVEVLGSGACNTKKSTQCIHDGQILARRSSNENDVMNGGASLQCNGEGLP